MAQSFKDSVKFTVFVLKNIHKKETWLTIAEVVKMTTIFQSFFSKEDNQPLLEEYIKEEGQMAMPNF